MYIFHKMPVLSLVVLLVLIIEDGEAGNNTSNCKLGSVSKNSQAEKEALSRLEPLTNRKYEPKIPIHPPASLCYLIADRHLF